MGKRLSLGTIWIVLGNIDSSNPIDLLPFMDKTTIDYFENLLERRIKNEDNGITCLKSIGLHIDYDVNIDNGCHSVCSGTVNPDFDGLTYVLVITINRQYLINFGYGDNGFVAQLRYSHS